MHDYLIELLTPNGAHTTLHTVFIIPSSNRENGWGVFFLGGDSFSKLSI